MMLQVVQLQVSLSSSKKKKIIGCALGDVACFIIGAEGSESRQLNVIKRKGNSATDTGGQLMLGRLRSMGISGELSFFDTALDEKIDRYVLLCTDGLTDNLSSHDMGRLITLIISHSFFDYDYRNVTCPFTELKEDPSPRLPDYQQLKLFLSKQILISKEDTCEVATSRLSHYLYWVTLSTYKQQQSDYSFAIQQGDEIKKLREKLSSPEQKQKRENKKETKETKSTLSSTLDDNNDQVILEQIENLNQQMKERIEFRKKIVCPAKTDDALIILLDLRHIGIKS